MPEHLDTASFRAAEAAGRAQWDRLRAEHPDVERFSATCRSGWLPLVSRFLIEGKAALPAEVRLDELRACEKWGLLDLTYRVKPRHSDAYRALTVIARSITAESGRTCEVCGRPGSLRRSGGWHVTRCDEHVKAGNLDGGDLPQIVRDAEIMSGSPDPEDDSLERSQ